MGQCIYCLEQKKADDFNREHVIPEAFGGFEGALVLHGAVCSDCNSYFGNTIDLRLARGTEEGLQRYFWDVKRPEQVEDFRYDALTITYQGEDDYDGALLRLEADGAAPNGFRATLADQVGFAHSSEDGFVWMSLEELYRGRWKDRDDIDWRKGVKIYAADLDEVRDYLKGKGVSLPNWRQMSREVSSGDEISVLQISRITTDVRRVMSKITFNYLTHVHDVAFALRTEFNSVRQFIRYGEEPEEQLVYADGEDIIPPPPDAPPDHRAVIHIVTVEHPLNGEAAIAQVSLFGGLRYQIILSGDPIPDLRYSGHIFNLADRRVIALGNRRQTEPGATDSPL